MNKFIDTNIVLRFILNDVPKQRDLVKKMFNTGDVCKFEVADIVFVEVEFALRKHYDLSRADIGDAISAFLQQGFIIANKQLFQTVLSLYIKETKVSFVDLMLLNYAKLNKATPLITFDKDLAKINDDVEVLK